MRSETDFQYYQRRAHEELRAANDATCGSAKAIHMRLSDQYRALAELIGAQRGRYIVNDND